MPEFNSDMDHSKRMQPAGTEIICGVFDVTHADVRWIHEDDHDFALDLHHHIDVIIKLRSGASVTGQVKALRNQHHKHRTMTFEYYQDRSTQERGEFFNIKSQF
ncbi:unnamed protein product, partial [marine sediment metagenome]